MTDQRHGLVRNANHALEVELISGTHMKHDNPEDLYFLDECRPIRGAIVKRIKNFSARGMLNIYGQGDHFVNDFIFNIDAWRTRNGRILVRFWSPNPGFKRISYEVIGIPIHRHPNRASVSVDGFPDSSWIPRSLRKEYHDWIQRDEHGVKRNTPYDSR